MVPILPTSAAPGSIVARIVSIPGAQMSYQMFSGNIIKNIA